MADDSDQPDDTMRGRVPGSRLRLWLLLEADRWVVAGIPLAAVFVSLVVLGPSTRSRSGRRSRPPTRWRPCSRPSSPPSSSPA